MANESVDPNNPLGCNVENMRQGIRALRSGEYTQAIGALESVTRIYEDDDFPTTPTGIVRKNCCLGVMTREAMKSGVPITVVDYGVSSQGFKGEGSESSAFLVRPAMNWLGIARNDPDLFAELPAGTGDGNTEPVVERHSATWCNDELLLSFDQIADGFERRFLPLDWAVTEASRLAAESETGA